MRNAEPRLKFIKPMEPVLVLEPPLSDDWLHEIKYDGFRVQLILDWAGARAFTRNGHDWSKRFWPVVAAAEKLKAKSFILDGEMIAPEPDGRPNFHAMHSRMSWNAELLAFVAFDILYLDGADLRVLPAVERKALLWDLVKPAKGIIQYSQHVEGGGAEFHAAADAMGLEGMVSKRRASPYRAGKTDAWVKVKCWDVSDFDLWGIKRQAGAETRALMGRDGRYAGSAALPKGLRERLWQRVKAGKSPPGLPQGVPQGVPNAIAGDDVEWLQPGLVGTVRTLRGEPKLRHATLQGFREKE
ncbi:RNA ligase family protein [Mesorhizobium opportunistum]|uniref:ATP dependent DNA ligase n=1 Tax=Mesorhizobium opportunistum (strain LMG 24607 / HAMBI 3007 / WSM2075) TaxID=536019 RepID=F7Y107_MESOW|nr:RNA ligase family protein [Mesorhizobium opportunistum]AEH88220.1 ATP dependent DNA ligase [Mesorhizobium opportunistum WSM2075]